LQRPPSCKDITHVCILQHGVAPHTILGNHTAKEHVLLCKKNGLAPNDCCVLNHCISLAAQLTQLSLEPEPRALPYQVGLVATVHAPTARNQA
jgi:hypothetical protein